MYVLFCFCLFIFVFCLIGFFFFFWGGGCFVCLFVFSLLCFLLFHSEKVNLSHLTFNGQSNILKKQNGVFHSVLGCSIPIGMC